MAFPPDILILAEVSGRVGRFLVSIGVEILSNAIKHSREIDGIQIDSNHSIKIT